MANWVPFHAWQLAQWNGNAVDLDLADIRIALITALVAPNEALHDFWDDLQANEVAGAGYTAGGAALVNKTVTEAAGTVTWDGDDQTYAQQNPGGFTTARYAIAYVFNATASLARLIAYNDLGQDRGNVDGDLTLAMAATGLLQQT